MSALPYNLICHCWDRKKRRREDVRSRYGSDKLTACVCRSEQVKSGRENRRVRERAIKETSVPFSLKRLRKREED